MNRSQRANKGPKGNGSSGPSEPGNYWSNLLSFPTSDAYLFQPLVAILIDPVESCRREKAAGDKSATRKLRGLATPMGARYFSDTKEAQISANCRSPVPPNPLKRPLSFTVRFIPFLARQRKGERGGGGRSRWGVSTKARHYKSSTIIGSTARTTLVVRSPNLLQS